MHKEWSNKHGGAQIYKKNVSIQSVYEKMEVCVFISKTANEFKFYLYTYACTQQNSFITQMLSVKYVITLNSLPT